ncbi:MAG: hypothetical protein M1839_003182 [Geoglossum umbratile]|nr:MAG: hypothetical protein M1839_003182 [Geoglossum umbratile]
MKNTHSWKEHVDLLIEILGEKDHRERVFVVDCDVIGMPLKDLCIFRYQNDSLVTPNVLKQRRHLADKCIMRYDPRYLDATVKDDPWPPKRKMVKIPCPGGGPNCDSNYDWICFRCHVSIEYGTDDSHMYCECGRVECRGSLYEFNCQRPGHTPNYAKYGDFNLSSIMKKLNPPPEVNILILGETGVGKSTFINAFINYLTFTSLDHALSATQLNWVIPCSFATSTVDKSIGKIVQRVVEIRSDGDLDEVSGVKGKSAKQKATAYPIYIGGKLIRLIDTPGIGDTRGVEQDKQNMVHTLSVLKNYRTLHGILILLKPQNARLGVMFKFCINELLTHLHRDAANNVVFGFTNTRGTMYTPGDAVGPLETQLENYIGVLPGLYGHTVYCFDSESFRYLAARKQEKELDLGHIEDYRRSWDHSANESQRLMDYFEKRDPHSVDSTLGLAEIRDLITRLVEPMAEVVRVVSVSIAKSKKDMQDLSTTQKTGAELKGLLNLTKETLVSKTLKEPFTVCDNRACVSLSRVLNPNGESVALRKSLCHDPCSLTEIMPDVRGAKGITGCYAFTGGKCRKCSHTPEDHMHIRVLYSEETETTIDPIVQAKLNANASDVQIKEAQMNALKRRIAEYEREQDLLEDAQAKFSYYLEKNSITVYNNVTIEYLDHLIKDEKTKRGPGGVGHSDLIEALEKSKKRHQEFVEAMRKGKQAQSSLVYQTLDARGVTRLVNSLCAMKHYGPQLKDAADAVQNAYAAQFRERPFRVRPDAFPWDIPGLWGKNNSRSGPSQGSAGPSRNSKPTRSMPLDGHPKRASEIAPLLPPLTPPNASHGTPPSDPPKRALQNGHAQSKIDSSAQPAPPPPYEPSAPASVPNQNQPQSPSRLRGFKNFLRAKFSSRSP